MKKNIKVKVKVLCHLAGVFPEYQPEVGKIYDATYLPNSKNGVASNSPICIIAVKDKKIALRPYEYQLMEEVKCKQKL